VEIRPEIAVPPGSGVIRAWERFWFDAADPISLHVMRVLAGLLFLSAFLPLAGHADAVFGLTGWFDRLAYPDAVRLTDGPPRPITWSVFYLCGTHPAAVTAVYWVSIGILTLFTAGLWTRLTAILSWVVIASFTASPAIASDADSLLLVLAFYLMIGYVLMGLGNTDQSMLSRLLGSRDSLLFGQRLAQGSAGANVALRLLQVHFAVIMVACGLHKLQSGDWWGGLALWYPLHPPMQSTASSFGSPTQVASSLTWLSLCAYAVLAWQIAFPTFSWRPRWRLLLIAGSAIGCLGCWIVYGDPVFGPAAFVGCLSYVTASEWHRVGALITRISGLERAGTHRTPAQEPLVPQPLKS
jgi:hypothetical protein